jgi:hypothetical protein
MVGLIGGILPIGLSAGWKSAAAATPPMPRMPLEEFAQSPDLVAALRKGVTAMKARKPSDPRSWFYQAAIHGVTDEKVQEALKIDPGVANVDRAKYWNQCPHSGQNSANFLPWHRGYTYHFERILRLHTEREDFSLPYWNYTDPKSDRKFPQIYGIQYLDGNLDNDDPSNINPLFDEQRDFYFTTYQHPLTKNLPLLSLTDEAVDISLPMNSPVFFGATEREGIGGGIADADASTRGLLESYPHDQIHRATGGIIGSFAGDMAVPPTAGFDPIFSVHHTNVDWLWVRWSCMPGKSWGQLPSSGWFDERPWYFFDETGAEVNETRRNYFDHRALGIRFKYEDTNCTPLELPTVVADTAPRELQRTEVSISRVTAAISASARNQTPVRFDATSTAALGRAISDAQTSSARGSSRITLRISDIEASTRPAVGFDVHVTADASRKLSRSDPSFVGSVNLFNHQHHGMPISQDFDATAALARGVPNVNTALTVVLVPYPLLREIGSGNAHLASQPLTLQGFSDQAVRMAEQSLIDVNTRAIPLNDASLPVPAENDWESGDQANFRTETPFLTIALRPNTITSLIASLRSKCSFRGGVFLM